MNRDTRLLGLPSLTEASVAHRLDPTLGSFNGNPRGSDRNPGDAADLVEGVGGHRPDVTGPPAGEGPLVDTRVLRELLLSEVRPAKDLVQDTDRFFHGDPDGSSSEDVVLPAESVSREDAALPPASVDPPLVRSVLDLHSTFLWWGIGGPPLLSGRTPCGVAPYLGQFLGPRLTTTLPQHDSGMQVP